VFHDKYYYFKGSKIKPFWLKTLNRKVKKISCKISFFVDIIFKTCIDYPILTAVFSLKLKLYRYEKEKNKF